MRKLLLFIVLFIFNFLSSSAECDTEFGCKGDYDKAVANQADTEFGPPGAYDAAVAKQAESNNSVSTNVSSNTTSSSSSDTKYTGTDYTFGEKSTSTDHNSSGYYNNNLKENTFTKDNLSNLQAAGYVDSNGNLTEAGKLASGQTDGKCGAKCAESLNTKAAGLTGNTGSKGGGPDDLTSPNFIIKVNDISPGIEGKGNNTSERINWLLGTLIQKMMIALGTLSILIMTIGSGYIVFHNGQDELLSKGKSIFMAGIYAMIVALSSYLLVSVIRYILYT